MSGPTPPGVPAVDFELDRFQLVVLRAGGKSEAMDPATVQRLQAEHLAYLFHLQRSGKLLAAGAVAPRSPDQLVTGIGFFALGSVEEVRALMKDDPSVRAGLESAEVLLFMCPRGSLRFPNAST